MSVSKELTDIGAGIINVGTALKSNALSTVEFGSSEIKTSTAARMLGPAKLTHQHGLGWTQVDRNSRLSLTLYQTGGLGLQLDIPIIFDGFIAGKSIDPAIAKMEKLETYVPSLERTPIVYVDAGGGIPHDRTRDPRRAWVVYGIDWQDFTMNQSNQRIRQFAAVTLWEWIPDVDTPFANVPYGSSVPNTYKVQPGDTLQKIAAYYYGDQSQWHAIAAANNLRDPNHPPVGSTIKLPQIKVT